MMESSQCLMLCMLSLDFTACDRLVFATSLIVPCSTNLNILAFIVLFLHMSFNMCFFRRSDQSHIEWTSGCRHNSGAKRKSEPTWDLRAFQAKV